MAKKLSKVYSGAIVGIEAKIVEIETDVSYGLRAFEIVGLPDQAIQEATERVGVALRNSGFKSPRNQPLKVLVNLAPADVKKEGALYDLPIALGFLASSRQLTFDPEKKFIVGELSLDGRLRPIKGALAFALLARQRNYKEVVLPKENAAEASFAVPHNSHELKIIGVESLNQAVSYLNGSLVLPPVLNQQLGHPSSESAFALSLIRGQNYAKRALETAAAGSHNILFQGPPGTGKTLLAKALISLLPTLAFEDALEVTKIYSIAGLLGPDTPLITTPPFRSPHHTSSEVALIGGGNPPRAGEITLAHCGVLFLDEFPEFHRDVLESLRQPLEEGRITLLRSRHQLSLPARFMLVAATNPCPCGYWRDPERECVCTPSSVQKYKRKLSGPLMDRIDLFIEVPQIKYEEIANTGAIDVDQEMDMRQNVARARTVQSQRFGGTKTNAQMDLQAIKKYCQIDGQSHGLLQKYVDSSRLSARGYHRVLKLARTIADLNASDNISFAHVSEALSYRIRDQE